MAHPHKYPQHTQLFFLTTQLFSSSSSSPPYLPLLQELHCWGSSRAHSCPWRLTAGGQSPGDTRPATGCLAYDAPECAWEQWHSADPTSIHRTIHREGITITETLRRGEKITYQVGKQFNFKKRKDREIDT